MREGFRCGKTLSCPTRKGKNRGKKEEKRVENLLKKYDIPTTFKINDVEDFYAHFFLDKKSSNSKIKFILPVGIGDCKITDEIKKDDVIEILKGF